MSATTHVVEANHHRRPRMFFAAHPDDALAVVHGDAFSEELDLPVAGDQVTVVCGSEVIRGTVTSLVFLIAVTP